MALAAASSLWVAGSLVPQATYSLQSGPPRDLGPLTHVQLDRTLENTWAHGAAELADRSVEYRRPLDADRFRLAAVSGNQNVWVELRIPSGIEPEHYVPPNSFVGRLVPFDHVGLRHAALSEAVSAAFGRPPAPGAWLLVDGEAPGTTRWTMGLIGLFLAFAAFNVWGIVRLLRPLRAAPNGT